MAADVGLGYLSAGSSGTQDVRLTTVNIINTSFLLIGVIFVIIVLISGAFYLFSQNNPEKKAKAKKILISGIIGLLIILLAFAITTFILNALGIKQQPNIPGDASGDGRLGTEDEALMEEYLRTGSATCRDRNDRVIDCRQVLDLDNDGIISPSDYTILGQKIINP